MPEQPCTIAICGKGGVGKTSVAAMMIRYLLADPENRVLAIDADPAMGLAPAMGITVARTVDDVRCDLVARLKQGQAAGRTEILAMLDYEMLGALAEKQDLAFLAIGRPEAEGCYCQANRMLKEIIETMAENFDYVIIDGEAGIEQVNRRVMETVTNLVLVSDTSARGLNVAGSIREVAGSAMAAGHAGLILNRIRDPAEVEFVRAPAGLRVLGWIPEDEVIRKADMEGVSILGAKHCPAIDAAQKCLSAVIDHRDWI